jgi:ribosomal protein L7Ae-like RNA K-turn-binding protein
MGHELSFLSLARKANRLESGEDPVSAAMENGKAKLLVHAKDASPRTVKWAVRMAGERGIPVAPLNYSKEELGSAIGRPPTAIAVMTDTGMAKSFVAKRDR